MNNTDISAKKLDVIEKMLWEDRRFLISMMLKLDKILRFVGDLAEIEESVFGDVDKFDEEKILKSIMEDLKNDIEDKKEDFIKYHKMINTDQVGES